MNKIFNLFDNLLILQASLLDSQTGGTLTVIFEVETLEHIMIMMIMSLPWNSYIARIQCSVLCDK